MRTQEKITARSEADRDNRSSKEAETTPYRARLGLALRQGLRDCWDRLGLVLTVSLTWALLLMVALALGRVLPVSWSPGLRAVLNGLLVVLLLSAPTAGVFHIAHLLAIHEEVGYGTFWRAVRQIAGVATCLGLIHLVALTIGLVNLWFYLSLKSPLGAILTLLCLYAFLLWGMMGVYHFPLLVAQEAGVFDEPERRAKRGAFAVLRRAFYVALGVPIYSVGLFAVVLAFTAVSFLTAIPFVALWMGGLALLTTPPTRALLIQFGVIPVPVIEPVIPDEEFRISARKESQR